MESSYQVFKINDSGKIRAMTLQEVAESGVSALNQPLPLRSAGKEIEEDIAGYAYIDKKGRTYLPEEVTPIHKFFYRIKLFPVVIRLNTGNFGYHYEVCLDKEIKE